MSVVPYRLDAADPRAPTLEQWAAMSVEERARVVDSLPSEPPSATLPEGDRHRIPKEKAVETLREYFRRIGKKVYLSAELPVYYPGEPWFAPDLIAVVDAEPGPRVYQGFISSRMQWWAEQEDASSQERSSLLDRARRTPLQRNGASQYGEKKLP